MKATRDDVALLAGVSSATVSYVLNQSRPVSESTIKKVKKAVSELDYHPDAIARSMVKGRSKQIGVIVNDIINPVHGEVVLGFESAAIEKGYFVNICTTFASIENYISNFISRRNDGLYITAMPNTFAIENIYKLHNYNIKIVCSGSVLHDNDIINHVNNNFEIGIRQAVGYLKDLGHKKIAMISAYPRNYKYDDRLEIFCKSVYNSIPNALLTIIEGKDDFLSNINSGKVLTRELLSGNSEFTAVFCTNDMMAYGCISELYKAGLKVPEDVSVIGVDDIIYSADFYPPLTTIGFDKQYQGRRAFEILYNNIKNNQVINESIPTELIIRESCCLAKN